MAHARERETLACKFGEVVADLSVGSVDHHAGFKNFSDCCMSETEPKDGVENNERPKRDYDESKRDGRSGYGDNRDMQSRPCINSPRRPYSRGLVVGRRAHESVV